MRLSPLTIAVASLAAFPSISEARVVSVGFSRFDTIDEVVAEVRPNRRPLRGWHYETSILNRDVDPATAPDDCAYWDYVPSEFGSSPFTVTFTSPLARAPTGGAPEWCEGRGIVVLTMQRDGTTSPKYMKYVAKSRSFTFVTPRETDSAW